MSLERLMVEGAHPRQITRYLNDLVEMTGPCGDPNVEAEINRAVTEFPEDLYFQAIFAKYYIKTANFERALEVAPNDAVGRGLKAQAYIGMAKYEDALRVAPDSAVGLGLQAQANIGKGDYVAALAILDRKIALAPDDAVGYYMKAAIYFHLDKVQSSMLEINKIFQLPKKDVSPKTMFNTIILLYAMAADENPLIVALEHSTDSGLLLRAKERAFVYRKERSEATDPQSAIMDHFWKITSTMPLRPVDRKSAGIGFTPYSH
ncbi:hypothetical protein CMO93_04100 [Candidatus Woesearchaeota archaeon]|nr:hypothetical protein [Candidatus Woesearchaeota archaeon]|tara:strand:- start:3560 stop:4345 length:786 start_codon:yes stop_codon:yes gene_type:complete